MHRFQGGLVGQLPDRVLEVLACQPEFMSASPGLPAGIDDALAQQQFGNPVPGTHQIATDVFPGTDQIPCSFLVRRWNSYPGDLTQLQEPGQMQRVLCVSFYPVPGRALELRWCRDHCVDPGGQQEPCQAKARWSCLVNDS